MLSYYQPFILPFLQLRPNKLPEGVNYYYYHSFEDGLWDLIQHKFKKKHLHFLVPDFYCSDVLDNLKIHGHRYTYYPLDRNFQITTLSFKKYLWVYKPDVVIIFHAAGITSNLMSDTSWLSDLPRKTIIIEDSVHRLVNPTELTFLNERHFVIDSLRKVSPISGSRMFGTDEALDFKQSRGSYLSAYYLKSTGLYLTFRVCLQMGFLLSSAKLMSWCHNTLLRIHDEIIGDEYLSQPGLPIIKLLIERLNYQKVHKVKSEQVKYYKQLTGKADAVSNSDEGRVYIFPLVYERPPQTEITDYLNTRNIPVWYKFTDTPWSSRYSVLFLPLGFHVNRREIFRLVDCLKIAQQR